MATNPRSPFYIDIGGNKVVKLQLADAAFADAGLLGSLGIVKGVAPDFGPPAGKTKVGDGRLAALQNGCFAVNLVYDVSSTKKQTAKVLVSPAKADTIFAEAKTKKYRNLNISDIRVPRRRVLSF